MAWRWLPVAHSSVMAASGIPHRARWRSTGGSTVRLGMGRVRSGKTTTTRAAPAANRASDGPLSGLLQGPAHGSGFVGQPGELGRQDDRRIIGDFDRDPVRP